MLDRYLLPFDLRASVAHANGLARIGVLTASEAEQIEAALGELADRFRSGEYELGPPHEDCHSAIEAWLVEKLGDTGRKIHAGRSRNDQVQVALRLYLRDRIRRLEDLAAAIADQFLERADRDRLTPMPGYTHLQRAVPSTVGLWMAAFGEAFIDVAWLARQTGRWLNISPLGTAAGFGVNLALDRGAVATELEFDRLQINPMYVQNSRGQFELQTMCCFAQATLSLRRFAWDVSLFTTREFGFASLPPQFETGSSIMPNKSNPDVVELMRAAHAPVQSAMQEIQTVIALPSGYHRDLQAIKPPVIRGIESAVETLSLVPNLVASVRWNTEKMRTAIEPSMYATDVAVERVVTHGMAFRDAYRQPISSADLSGRSPESSAADRVSMGGCGALGLEQLRDRLTELRDTRIAGAEL